MRLLPPGRAPKVVYLPRRVEPLLLPPGPFTDAERLALGAVRERFAPLPADDDPVGETDMRRLQFYRWMLAAGRIHDGGAATEAERRLAHRHPPTPASVPSVAGPPAATATATHHTLPRKDGQSHAYQDPLHFYRVHHYPLPFPPSDPHAR